MSRRHLYQPMLARVASSAFDSKDWVFEIKWDGFRAISYIDDVLSIRSRSGKELKGNFPELEELMRLGKNLVVDGEIVVLKDGAPDFQALLERGQAVSEGEIRWQVERSPVVYVVFDVLERNGASLTKSSLLERKRILKESLKEGDHVVLNDFVEEAGGDYFQSALDRGLEGVMAKRKDSEYEEGRRSGSWLKIKKIRACDCVIFGYTKGSGARVAAFGALIVGLYDKDGLPVYVGKVGTGFTEATLRLLMDKFEKLKVSSVPFTVDDMEGATWLEPKLVCEVGYQVVTRDLRLRMPRFKRLREDKLPRECTVDQLVDDKKMDKTVSDKLSEYASKRRFGETPEPKGAEGFGEKRIFVVQEHRSRRLHYDLRLESGGVLKSWAVPKGMPESSQERRLAVQTEDHPYEYASFEGTIPEGQYGAGTVKIWDKGHFESKVWEDDKIEFTLDGERLKGRYVLVRLKRSKDENAWLLLKGKE